MSAADFNEYVLYTLEDEVIKKITISLCTEENTKISLSDLQQLITTTLNDNIEECKKIHAFGNGILSNPSNAKYFLIGWITKSIILFYETKHDVKLKININEETLSKNEIKETALASLKNMIKIIEDGDLDSLSIPKTTSNIDLKGLDNL